MPAIASPTGNVSPTQLQLKLLIPRHAIDAWEWSNIQNKNHDSIYQKNYEFQYEYQ